MDIDCSFGAWVSRRRRLLDLTREALAACAGCSVSALRKIENDERRPSRQLAELLATCLHIAPEECSAFLEVARGIRSVERLASVVPEPYAAVPGANLPAVAAVPALPAALIGRETELAALARLLGAPQCRLLTVTGPGGIGKTSLALGLAARQAASFCDGAVFVPLAALTSPRFIVPAIADSVGCTFSGALEPQMQLLHFLRPKTLLLILDNLEHLLAGAGLLGEILQQAPGVKLLVTSRERLNLAGEWLFDLQGLPVPPADQVEQAEEYSAVALFLQSARRVQHDFVLTAAERPAVVHICALAEGMPLAIELAAAWLRVLNCEEIAGEIARGVDFLAGALRDAPPRQRSLRATFDHSWNLLNIEERQFLSRLAIFQGGFDRAAAGQVAGAGLPILAALADKSLLRRAESGLFDLHEMVRQYALTRLAEDPADEISTRDRHSEFYLAQVRDLEPVLRSGKQRQALRELVGAIDNLRAAWTWAVQQRRLDLLAPALRGFGLLCELGGWLREGTAQLELVAEVVRSAPVAAATQIVLGEVLAQQGLLNFRWGRFDLALSQLQASLSLLRPCGEVARLVHPLLYCGTVLHLNGDLEAAQATIDECLACACAAGERWAAAYAIYNLGYLASLRGDYTAGYRQMCDGLAIWREIGEPRSIALGLNYLNRTMVELGRYAEAQRCLEESLAICEQSNDRWGKGTAYRGLGHVALARGDAAAAELLFSKSLEVFAGYVVGWDIVRSQIDRAEAIAALSRPAEARHILLETLVQVQSAHALPLALEALAVLAEVQLQSGASSTAIFRSASYVLVHPAATWETRARARKLLDAAGVPPGTAPTTGELPVATTLETLAAELTGVETRHLSSTRP